MGSGICRSDRNFHKNSENSYEYPHKPHYLSYCSGPYLPYLRGVNGFNPHPTPTPWNVGNMRIHITTNSNDQNIVICIAHKWLTDVATRCVSRAVNASKCVCGRGSIRPDPAWGAYSAPQTFYLDLGEGVGKEGEGRRKRKGRGGKRKGRGGQPEQTFWLRLAIAMP